MDEANSFSLDSTDFCRKHTRVRTVPISFEAPGIFKEIYK